MEGVLEISGKGLEDVLKISVMDLKGVEKATGGHLEASVRILGRGRWKAFGRCLEGT